MNVRLSKVVTNNVSVLYCAFSLKSNNSRQGSLSTRSVLFKSCGEYNWLG